MIILCICCCRRHNKSSRKESAIGLNHDETNLQSRPIDQSPYYAMRPIRDYYPTQTEPHVDTIDVINCSIHGRRQALHIPEIYTQNATPIHRTDLTINKYNYSPTDV